MESKSSTLPDSVKMRKTNSIQSSQLPKRRALMVSDANARRPLSVSSNESSTSTKSTVNVNEKKRKALPTSNLVRNARPKVEAIPRTTASTTAKLVTKRPPLTRPTAASRLQSAPKVATSNPSSSSQSSAQSQSSSVERKKPATTKRPAWDMRGKISDMEEKRQRNQTRISELSTDWRKLEDMVANKESQFREASQSLAELQALKQIAIEKHQQALDNLRAKNLRENQQLEETNRILQQQASEMEAELDAIQQSMVAAQKKLEMERAENSALRQTITQSSASFMEVENELLCLKAQVEEADRALLERQAIIDSHTDQVKQSKKRVFDLETQLLEDEKTRRSLHNTIQDLKGNIRVFCRVRPALESEKERPGGLTPIKIDKEGGKLELSETVSSTFGKTSTKVHPFTFDMVFPPESTQSDCFEEISELVQSALDGFNVCIFAYGQTGSGKTHTMQGPARPTPETAGMIPRAVEQIYNVAQKLGVRHWTYKIEGQFMEIYNEAIHDLLGDVSDYGKIKHEIRHESNGRTQVTNMTTVLLDSPAKVTAMLKKANHNRATGATNLNERSSRSHSVFVLRLTGENPTTGERCNGILNLIDLAGSERLAQSGSTGDRLKETQAINKSLSCLGDVIHALTNKNAGHIPYRNSKLTYLLQNSLGGNSKTLMFVNISPLSEHFGESLCSLRFATKVNSCRIGTPTKN